MCSKLSFFGPAFLVSALASSTVAAVTFDPGYFAGPAVTWSGGAMSVSVTCRGNEEFAGMLTAPWNPATTFTADPVLQLLDSSGTIVKSATVSGGTADWYMGGSRTTEINLGMVSAGAYTLRGRNGLRQTLVSGEGYSGFTLQFSVVGSPPPQQHQLMLRFLGDGQGRVTATPTGNSYNTNADLMYPAGTNIVLNGEPLSGSTWGGFDGAGSKSAQQITVKLDSDRSITVAFVLPEVVNHPPTLRWTSTPGTVSSGANYTISAHADDDGNLNDITIFRNQAAVSLTSKAFNKTVGDASFTSSDVNAGSNNQTITYTAVATDQSGAKSAVISQDVIIAPQPAGVDASLSAAVTAPVAPGAATLTWTTTSALTASVTGPNGFSSSALSGTQALTNLAPGSYTYTIAATGPANSAVQRTTTFVIGAAGNVTADISVTPASVTEGGSANVEWNSTNATSVAVTGSDGFRSTLPAGALPLSNLAAGTYVYSITAQGQSGPAAKSATLVVAKRDAVSAWITVTPDSGAAPATTTVAWGSSNADQVSVTTSAFNGITLSAELNGSTSVSALPAGTHTFTITASGAGGTTTQSATLTATTSAGGSTTRNLAANARDPLTWQGGTQYITGDSNLAGSGIMTLYKVIIATTQVWEAVGYDADGVETYGWVDQNTSMRQELARANVTFTSNVGQTFGSFAVPGSTEVTGTHYTVQVAGTDGKGGSAWCDFTVPGVPGPRPQTVTITPATASVAPGDTVTLTATGGNTGYVWIGATPSNGASATFAVPSGAMMADTYTVTVYSPAGGPLGASWLQSNYATATINVGKTTSTNDAKVSLLAQPLSLPWTGGEVAIQGSVLLQRAPTSTVNTSFTINGPIEAPYFYQNLGPVAYGVVPAPPPILERRVTLPPNLSSTAKPYTISLGAGTPTFSAVSATQTVSVAPIPKSAPPVITLEPPPNMLWDGHAVSFGFNGGTMNATGGWGFTVFSPGAPATVSGTLTFANGSTSAAMIQPNSATPLAASMSVAPDTLVAAGGMITQAQQTSPPFGRYLLRLTASSANGTTYKETVGTVAWRATANVSLDAAASGSQVDPDTGEETPITAYSHGWNAGASPNPGPLGGTTTLSVSAGDATYRFVRWRDSAGATLSYYATATATLAQMQNYFYAQLALTSSPKTMLTFDVAPLTFVYDGLPKSPKITPNIPDAPFVTTGTGSAILVGSYSATASADPNTAFLGSRSFTWNITPKPVTFTIDPLNVPYDGTPKSASIIASDPAATYSVTYVGTNGTTYGPSNNPPCEIGSYTVSAIASGNYSGMSSGTLSIHPPIVTFTFAELIHTFDGTPKSPQITASDASAPYAVVYAGASSSGTPYGPSSAPPTNAGSYTVTATAGSYFQGTGSATLTIQKATPILTWVAPPAVTYGQALGPTQLCATSNVTGTFTYVPAAGAVLAAGARTLSGMFSPADSANYTTTSATVPLTVIPAVLTVTADDKSRAYGAANPALTLTYSGFINGDTASSITAPNVSTPATAGSPVGSYVITVSGGSAGNYSIQPVNGHLTITKATLVATAQNASRAYGSSNPSFAITYSGFVNGDTIAAITAPNATTPATSSSATGVYPIVLSGGVAQNYSLTLVNGTLTVTKASLAVTADSRTRVYGTANPPLTATLSGFVNGDTPAVVSGTPGCATAATAASAVGNYTITVSGGSLAAANYSFGPFVAGTLTVTPASLTAKANDATKIYGNANPSFAISYTGFVNGDTAAAITPPTASTAATVSSGVGTYAIVLSGGAAPNYTLALSGGTLTITPAGLNVIANDQSRRFGAANPALTYRYTGFVNGDTAAVVNGSPILATTAGPASAIGTYPITISAGTLAAPNYQFSYSNGTLTVTAQPVTFTFANLTHVFSGTPKTATCTPSDPNATYASDLTKGPAAGTYTVTATANGNYVGTGSATLTISPKPVTFTFGNLAHTYDGAAKAATVTPSDPATTFTADLSKGPNAGSYPVRADATGNYAGTGSAVLVIAPAAQTVVVTPAVATAYAGQNQTFTASGGHTSYTWGGSAGATGTGDSISVNFPTVGTFNVTVLASASGNYQASNTAVATVTVVSAHEVTEFTPVASNFTVTDSASPMHGQSYGRIWQAGGWVAYLGRSGVRFQVKASAWPAVKTVELQALPPGGTWSVLATQAPAGNPTSVDLMFSVQLGASAPGMPLVPLSYQQGNPQTGAWRFRARVQDSNDGWSAFSAEVPVDVVLPIVTRTVSGQTVPPAGPLGDWFTASPVQTYSIPLWVP